MTPPPVFVWHFFSADTDVVYSREIGVDMAIGYLRIWDSSNDVWASTTSSGNMLEQLQAHWNSQMQVGWLAFLDGHLDGNSDGNEAHILSLRGRGGPGGAGVHTPKFWPAAHPPAARRPSPLAPLQGEQRTLTFMMSGQALGGGVAWLYGDGRSQGGDTLCDSYDKPSWGAGYGACRGAIRAAR